jgi:hypothetical protein
MAAVLPAACTRHQQAPVEVPIIVHDTVVAVDVQYVPVPMLPLQKASDSAYIEQIREQYAQRQHSYLRELVKMDSLVSLLWDGIAILIAENEGIEKKAEQVEHLRAEVAGLQQRLSVAAIPAPSYKEVVNEPTNKNSSAGTINEAVVAYNKPTKNNSAKEKLTSWRQRSQQLLALPRTIYNVGADDEQGEVEITNSGVYSNELYIAAEIWLEDVDVEKVEARMNEASALYQYADRQGHVFVFALQKLSGSVKLDFHINNRNYVIHTGIKNIVSL